MLRANISTLIILFIFGLNLITPSLFHIRERKVQDPKNCGKNTEASRQIFGRNINVNKFKKNHNQVLVWFDHFYLVNPNPNTNPNPREIK